jgi:hypothetical protein
MEAVCYAEVIIWGDWRVDGKPVRQEDGGYCQDGCLVVVSMCVWEDAGVFWRVGRGRTA